MTAIVNGKRTAGMEPASIQTGNRSWWTSNTMSYDWKDKIGGDRFGPEWFDAADARFVQSARLFAHRERPFDRVIPYAELAGRDVLEIGCGMGMHSQLLASAGARLHAIDLSPTSVEATRRRFALKGLQGDIREADAEAIPHPDASFDFIWSWGVIHHSARTGRIVREIHRVMRPSGSCRVMVYHRGGIIVPITYLKDHILKGRFRRQDFDTTLLASSDGFSARFYTRDQFEDLFRTFFGQVTTRVYGLDSDALPLPRGLRQVALRLCSQASLMDRQARNGAFLFLEASKPE
jgi:SAM-dependent methyltransferase